MNTAIEMNQTINSTSAQKEPSMIVFSKERKDAIHAMKAIIKNKDAYSHAHFVMYSALRGQDIRKTSHMPHGDNAIAELETLQKRASVYQQGKHAYFFSYLKNEKGDQMFSADDMKLILEILDEAKAITELTPETNDGVNTMYAS